MKKQIEKKKTDTDYREKLMLMQRGQKMNGDAA